MKTLKKLGFTFKQYLQFLRRNNFFQNLFCWILSSYPEVFIGKDVLKIFSKFTGEHSCRRAILIKLQSNSIEIILWHGCSLVDLMHIFRIPFFKNTSGRLLLEISFFWKVYFLLLRSKLSLL